MYRKPQQKPATLRCNLKEQAFLLPIYSLADLHGREKENRDKKIEKIFQQFREKD